MIYGYLFLICFIAQSAAMASGVRLVSLPIVVLEIACGIAIGPTGLHILPSSDLATGAALAMLSQLGFIMLMFMVGTHLPIHETGIRGALVKSGIATVLCFIFGFIGAQVLVRVTAINQPALFTLLLANSSAAVFMPLARDKALDGPVILFTKVWVILADAITIVALPLALAPDRLLSVSIGSTAIGVIAALSFFGLKWFRNSTLGDYFRTRSKRNGQALDFKQSLMILFGLAFVAYEFKVSFLVPGFAAGAVVALIGEPRRFTKQLVGLAEGFFIPMFFVTLGAELDFNALLHSRPNIELALYIALATTVVHLVVAALVRLPLQSGLAACSQLGLPAAVASLGTANGMLDPVQAAAIVAASMLSVIICTAGTLMLQRYSIAIPTAPAPVAAGALANTEEDHPGHDHR